VFIAAGKVASECVEAAKQFEAAGGILIDRFISDDEIIALYRHAALVWAVYAPTYDQASGIAGRAYQFGIPIAVRHGSHMNNLLAALEHPAIAVPFGDKTTASTVLMGNDTSGMGGTRRALPMREQFQTTMRYEVLS
jgi:hypothetical protein